MNVETIKFLIKIDYLEKKLIGEDKKIFVELFDLFNECVRMLEEEKLQVKKQKEVIDKAIEYILECSINEKGHINVSLSSEEVGKLLDILNEALE